jgi:hypothetical protein
LSAIETSGIWLLCPLLPTLQASTPSLIRSVTSGSLLGMPDRNHNLVWPWQKYLILNFRRSLPGRAPYPGTWPLNFRRSSTRIVQGLGTSDCKTELCTRHIPANPSIDERAQPQIAVERFDVLDFRWSLANPRLQSCAKALYIRTLKSCTPKTKLFCVAAMAADRKFPSFIVISLLAFT